MLVIFRSFFYLVGLFILIFIAGCAPTSTLEQVQWQQHQARLTQLHRFQLSGKLAYLAPDQRQSLTLFWQNSPEEAQLQLTHFLGKRILEVTRNEEGVSAITQDNRYYTAANEQSLIQNLTGLHLPFNELKHWILGLPSQADHYQLNELNTLAQLTKTVSNQLWQVTFDEYQSITWQDHPLLLPKKLTLQQGDLVLKLSIAQWKLTK